MASGRQVPRVNVPELIRDDVPATGERCGLASADAVRLLAEHGRNELRADPGPTILSRIGHQLHDPMILLLCGAFALVVAVGDRADAAIIAAVVVLNTVIGVVQDVRAQHAIDALSRMAAPVARAWRDGRLRQLPAAELVPGDVVRLESGDVVPADLSLLEAAAVEVDEAAMTGESMPVARAIGEELLSGTVVTRGRAVGTVVRTGPGSALGRIAALVGGRVRPDSAAAPARRPSCQLVLVTGALCVVVLGSRRSCRGESWTPRAAILAVSLGVAAVPGVTARRGHRSRWRSAPTGWPVGTPWFGRLPAVETLGSVTVLASDKTGTLTPGSPDRACPCGPRTARRGSGNGQTASQVPSPGPTRPGSSAARLLRDSALCNDGSLAPGPRRAGGLPVGDPFDVALLIAAAKAGADGRPR